MPLGKAHFYVLGLLALIFVAFWPRYFSQLPGGQPDWHVHTAGALLWVLLVILQSWSIHDGRRALHRAAGLASFALFILFLVGGVMAIQAEAGDLAAGLDDPENMFIGPFGFFDPLANIGFAVLYYGGLKHRRNVQLHSRYMIATLLFVIAPIVFRLLGQHVPLFDSSTPETQYRFAWSMAVGNAVAFAIAIYLYRMAPRFGRPFLIAAGFIAAQELLFETIGQMDGWARLFSQLAYANTPVLLVATGLVSLAIIYGGWQAGKRNTTGAVATAA